MEKYLKMSDCFYGEEFTSIGMVIQNALKQECFKAIASDYAKYASHAINSHDELVAMNKELLAALEEAKSVLYSINASWQHKVEVEDDDEPAFWQRNDWVKWAKGEVLQTVETAIAKAKAAS